MRTIEEKNGMIAEFMGYETYEHTNSTAIRLTEGNEFNSVDIGHIHTKFHISWDWLMPVVRHIVTDLEIVNDDVICSEEREHLMDIVPFAVIEDTYEAVLQFIEWYNKQK